MIVQNAGGKDFAPDPLLDIAADYDARVVGVVHIGMHQKQKHDGTDFIDEYDDIQQAIVEYEIVEDGTQVERGPEGAKVLENRRMSQFIKYSSHEKSGLYKLASTINPQSAYIEKKKGVVDTSLIIGLPVSLELKLNKAGDKNTIKAVNKIPPKYQEAVNPMSAAPFQYSVHLGAFPVAGKDTGIEDVPKWMLSFALSKALDAEEFGQLDDIEAHLEALNGDKPENTELEGDRLKKDPEPKAKAKAKEKAKVEPEAEVEDDEPEAEVETDGTEPEAEAEKEAEPEAEKEAEPEAEKEAAPRRSRRSRTAAKEDFSAMSDIDLETLLLERNILVEDDLDKLNLTVASDAEYKAELIRKLEG